MAAKPKKPSALHLRMVEVLKAHPEGITELQMATELGEQQSQFGRRRRYLTDWFIIEKRRQGKDTLYVYKGERETPLTNSDFSQKTRAEVLHDAHGRCGMCGRTIEKHGVTLVIDHKIPRNWGGTGVRENLWAICDECNAGKKAHFASQDQELMKKVMCHPDIHIRLGETLKAFFQKRVPAYMLSFVGDQDDWKKRTRDLRYLNWKFHVEKQKVDGRMRAFYVLDSFEPWPENPTKLIQEYERDRAKRNRVLKESKAAGESQADSEQGS